MSDETGNVGASGAPEATGSNAVPASGGTNQVVVNELAKKYADEAAEWRIKFREAEKKLAEASVPVATGDDKPSLAKLTRELSEVKQRLEESDSKVKTAQEKATQRTLDAAVSKYASSTLHPESAAILLKTVTRVAEDDAVEIRIRNEAGQDVWVAMTEENVAKAGIIPSHLLPTAGKGGTGSRGGSSIPVSGFDPVRAQNEQAYFNEHKDEARAWQAAQSKR